MSANIQDPEDGCCNCQKPLTEVPKYSKASLSSLLYQNFHELDIPRINLCCGCFEEITKKQAHRFDRANALLEGFVKQGVLDPEKEKSAEKEYNKFEKTLHSMLEKQVNQQNDAEQDQDQLYSQLMSEINEFCNLEDEAAELDHQNTVLEEEAEKLERELAIQALEYKSLKFIHSFRKVFDIKIYQEFGVIRQHQLRFPPKPNFSSDEDWINLNEGFGAILWLISCLTEALGIKELDYEILVMGPSSQIMYKNNILLMYGPFEDPTHTKSFNEGIRGVVSLSEKIYSCILQQNAQKIKQKNLQTKLPNKFEKDEIGKVPIEFNTFNIRRWELAMRNILENLDFITNLYSQLESIEI